MMQHPPQDQILDPSFKAGLSGVVSSFLENYFDAHDGDLPATGLYDRIIQEIERPLLQITLKAVRGNQKKAAEVLGINRNTLRKKLLELNINARDF